MKRPVGTAGTGASQLGLGGGTPGDPDEITGDDRAWSTTQSAWDAGMRYFDTAPTAYHPR